MSTEANLTPACSFLKGLTLPLGSAMSRNVMWKLIGNWGDFLDFFFCMCMDILPVSMSVHHLHAVPEEARRGHQICGKWS